MATTFSNEKLTTTGLSGDSGAPHPAMTTGDTISPSTSSLAGISYEKVPHTIYEPKNAQAFGIAIWVVAVVALVGLAFIVDVLKILITFKSKKVSPECFESLADDTSGYGRIGQEVSESVQCLWSRSPTCVETKMSDGDHHAGDRGTAAEGNTITIFTHSDD